MKATTTSDISLNVKSTKEEIELMSMTKPKKRRLQFVQRPATTLSPPEVIQNARTLQNSPNYFPIETSKYFKIPFFRFENTISFYLFTKPYISSSEFKYPPFSIGTSNTYFISMFVFVIIFLPLMLVVISFLFKGQTKFIMTEAFAFILVILSLIYTFIRNPGIVYYSDDSTYDATLHNYCDKCKTYTLKTRNVNHCTTCDVCCEQTDHHCGVFGKCIGKNNLICFYTSIVGGCLIMINIYIIVIYTIIKIVSD
jgi:hypothetical protein